MSLIKEIHGGAINFKDPDYEAGAVEREGAARDRADAAHFNRTDALKKQVARHFDASVRTWKESPASGDREWVTLKWDITTDSGKVLHASIGQDPFSKMYELTVYPKFTKKEGSFIPLTALSKELSSTIRDVWQKETGKKMYSMDVKVFSDEYASGSHYNPIHVMIGGPEEEIPTSKYIRGVEEILDFIRMKV